MTGRLEGRRILVTGAASGMGRAIAQRFAAEGAALALLDRDEAGVKRTAEPLGARPVVCDLASSEAIERAVAETVSGLGGLDGIVNAAGLLINKMFEDLDPDSWSRMLAVNLSGPFHLIRNALPTLRAAERATIVNICSTSAFLPMPLTTGYSATKAGLLMFTKSIALELGPKIRVNAICPGAVRTEMTRYMWENPEHLKRAEDRVALKRIGDPEDIANAALFLTSDESAFTTGAEIIADGGFSWR